MSRKCKYATRELIDAIFDLIVLLYKIPKSITLEVAFDTWNMKALVAHLIEWDRDTCSKVDCIKVGVKPGYIADINRFNEEARRKWEFKSWSILFKTFTVASIELIRKYLEVPVKLRDTKIWPEQELTISQMVQIDLDHCREHYEQIKKFLDRKGIDTST